MEELKKKISRVNTFKDLRNIRWRFRGQNGEYVGLNSYRCDFVPEENAIVFTGQDNEDLKKKMFERYLGPLNVEVLQ